MSPPVSASHYAAKLDRRDVVLNAQVPGLTRFRAAQDWLDRTTSVAQAADMPPPNVKLFQEFLRWKKTHPLVSKFVSQ
jgi:hypothetical protein